MTNQRTSSSAGSVHPTDIQRHATRSHKRLSEKTTSFFAWSLCQKYYFMHLKEQDIKAQDPRQGLPSRTRRENMNKAQFKLYDEVLFSTW